MSNWPTAASKDRILPERISRTIASVIRDEVIAGRYAVGEPIRPHALAQRFGVSTTPVREALTALERQGLLSSRTHRGYVVREVTADEVEQVYQIHAYVSQHLTSRAVRRLTDEDLDELEGWDEQMREAAQTGDFKNASDLNHSIHRRIHLAADSPFLQRFLRDSTPFVTRRADPRLPGWAAQLLEGHEGILTALRARDVVLSGARAAEHLLRAGRHAAAHAGRRHRPIGDGAP